MVEIAKLNNKKIKKIKHKPVRDVILIILSSITPIAALGFAIYCFIVLVCDHKSVPAFSGAVAGSLAIVFAGVTQCIIYVRNRYKHLQEKYEKTEHDYTNFFVKNGSINVELINFLVRVNSQFELGVDIRDTELILSFDKVSVPAGFAPLNCLRNSYTQACIKELSAGNDILVASFLNKKYDISQQTSPSVNVYYYSLVMALINEINKTFISISKILENKFQDNYIDDFYDRNMSAKIIYATKELLKFFLIMIYTKKNSLGGFELKLTNIPSAMIYYLQQKEN